MPKEVSNPPTLFASVRHGFSQAVVCRGGRTVYVSGQTAWDAARTVVGGQDLGEQTRQALRNIREALQAVGGSLPDVVSLRIYIVNYRPDMAAPICEALRAFFPGDSPPASTWVGVSALASEDFLIEIEAIASID
jgi:enamine deaminase RidA (YjgF/YER057c/UK114 family)